ncbi:MAG: galactose mutarotase [Telmatospirillum sp.]|nr:galactose mutarotase [Telmatospirillum sp.]
MSIDKFIFGFIGGIPVPGFVIRNSAGVTARLIAYGARLTELHLPDRQGHFADVVLGFDDLESYVRHQAYFGATCGRFSNRISGGSFCLDGHRYQLACNENGITHLHGGLSGFDRRIWEGEADAEHNRVRFILRSPDGDEGYPGAVEAHVSYQVTEQGILRIRMTASTDRATVINLVHHSYWNLGGHDGGHIGRHALMIDAAQYLPVDCALIPTGDRIPVAGTPFDFRQETVIGDRLDVLGGTGFDHNWCLRDAGGPARVCVRLVDRASGRGLEIETDQPGLQFYSSGQLPGDGPVGKGGVRYAPFGAVVLETQRFPDAPNVGHFPSALLRPGDVYRHHMDFRFFVE